MLTCDVGVLFGAAVALVMAAGLTGLAIGYFVTKGETND